MASTNNVGRMVWYDFVTRDIEKAKAFYGELLGWKYEGLDMGEAGTYETIKVGEKAIGGFTVPKGPNANTVPPHWTAYVEVADAASTVERAKKLGGVVPVGPVEIPEMGAFGVSVDKEQAGISFYQSYNSIEELDVTEKPSVGEFCWTELMAEDVEGAKAYYGELFGWSFEGRDTGGEDPYFTAQSGAFPAAGIMRKPSDHKGPAAWLSYVFVEDLEAAVKRVEKIGGQLLVPPMPIKDVGRIAIISDDQGATVGLFSDPVVP